MRYLDKTNEHTQNTNAKLSCDINLSTSVVINRVLVTCGQKSRKNYRLGEVDRHSESRSLQQMETPTVSVNRDISKAICIEEV